MMTEGFVMRVLEKFKTRTRSEEYDGSFRHAQ